MHRTSSTLLLATAIVYWTGTFAAAQSAAPGVAPGATPVVPGQIILQQTPLGPMPADVREISITSDGGRVALAANSGTRRDVFIDGNEGSQYSSIVQMPSLGHGDAPRLLMISPDQSVVAYVATRGASDSVMVVNQKEGPVFDHINGALFSPVGHRLAYVATKGNQQFVVVDGAASPAYRGVSMDQLFFSGDGKHYGYVESSVVKQSDWHAVVDGKEGPGYTGLGITKSRMSRNGRYTYVADAGGANLVFMVVDGQAGPKYAVIQPAVFSEDGSHVAYIAMKKSNPGKWVAVIDGQEGPEFDRLSDVVFSPDGKHSAYSATEASGARNSTYAMVDGKKSLDYQSCLGFAFSPDSQHLAYVATASNQKSVVVLDGRESDAHDAITLQSHPFSPDGKRLAYVATDQQRQYLVVDGKVGPAYGAVDGAAFRFSPDSQHYIFKTRGGSSDSSFAMDDIQSTDFRDALVMTPDWKHSAASISKNYGTGTQSGQVMLDGKPIGKTYRIIQQLQISADGNHVAFIGTSADASNKNVHAVFDGHEGPANFRIDKLLLSPDGQHIAYACTEDGTRHYVVIDSLQGPVYDDVFGGVTQNFEAMQFHPDGSLGFHSVKDGKLSRGFYGAGSFAALPKSSDAGAASPMLMIQNIAPTPLETSVNP